MKNTNVQLIISVLVTAGFFYCLFRMMTQPVPEANKDMMNVMLGSLGTVWVLQMNYFFGSTSSSKEKDKVISEVALATPPPAAPAPIVIPNAESVSVKTEHGDVNLKEKTNV